MANPTREEATEKRKAQRDSNGRFTAKNTVDAINETVQNVSNAVGHAVNSAQSIASNVNNIQQTVSPRSTLTKTASKDSFSIAGNIASEYGIADINLKDLLGSEPYKADANIPEMTAAEANVEKLKIQRQNNSLSVRTAKTQQGRQVVKLATEQRHLIGDVVDFATAAIEVGSKVLTNQISETNYSIRQSKLEQTEEQLSQQQIATNGTVNLTEGLREEWNLKLERQAARNDSLRLEIEGHIKNNEIKRQEIEARLLEA